MDCTKCTGELSAYLDGELDEALARQVDSHLSACGQCAQELRGLKASSLFVETNVRELEPTPAMWQNVQATVSTLPVPLHEGSWFDYLFGRRWIAWAASAAAAAALTIGIWGYARYQAFEKQLEQYMSDYIHARDVEEQRHFMMEADSAELVSDAALNDPEAAGNPFVVVKSSADENPFRSEEQ